MHLQFQELIRKSAEEGIVLLKNEKDTLPLLENETVSVFGRTQFEFYRSGTGSGGSVHVPYVTNLTDCLVAQSLAGNSVKINLELTEIYSQFIRENPFDNAGGAWAAEPFCQKDMEITEELAKKSALKSNKAVYVIGRTAGEDRDYKIEKGSYLLSAVEEKNLLTLCSNFEKVVVVLNTSGIMDNSWIEKEEFKNVTALLYAWQGGQESGRACANVLTGKAVPCGKLTDTVSRSIQDNPSTKYFGKRQSFYEEDIFVGYRYYNTFAKDRILYPFGFGKSYAQFEITESKAMSLDSEIKFEITVKNKGSVFAGKEIVQVYVSKPQGGLGNPDRQLVCFGKTRELKPGESQILSLCIRTEDLESYDDSGVTGNKCCYVLEAGDYSFYVGTDSLSAVQVKVNGEDGIHFAKTIVTKKLESCGAPVEKFQRINCGQKGSSGNYVPVYEDVPLNAIDIAQRIKANLPGEIPQTGNVGIKFDDVKNDLSKLDPFVGQLSVKELCTVVRGEGMLSRKVTPGIAAAFGGLSDSLHEYGIPCAGCADGPSGLRMDTGKEANLLPIGTQLACTWNMDLIRDLYVEEGKELLENEVDCLLGPGINIHRNPLGGRNFEYFSEDPLLTGLCACAVIDGLKAGGANGTLKHFALNNQESFRRAGDCIASERAIREIYLKPFEIAVKNSPVCSIMTSYNSVNGHWAASNYDTVTMILRREWGYTGFVMTDWWADMNDCVEGGEPSVRNLGAMVRAGNDVYMVFDNDGAEVNSCGDNLEESLENGKLTLGELQNCVKNILTFIIKDASVSKRPLRPLKIVDTVEPLVNMNDQSLVKVETKADILIEEGKDYLLEVKEDDTYSVQGTFCKSEDNLSQSATIVKINERSLVNFECRTTGGKDVSVTANQVYLKKGLYRIAIRHTKPGITLKKLKFDNQDFKPIQLGIFK